MKKAIAILIFLSSAALNLHAQDILPDSLLESTQVAADTVSNSNRIGEAMNAPDISELVSGYKIFWALIFILVGYFVIRFVSNILNAVAERSTRYRILIKSLVPVIKISGWTILIFIIISGIFQPPASTVLAFSASIGVAVGFASQDILKNIFAGIVIIIDRPFNSGDKIQVGEHYGEVIEIGLRATRIVTPDDSVVSLPNSEVMNRSVSNANSGEPNCQVVAEFFLPVSIDTVRVRKIAMEAASVSRYVYLKKPIVVLFFHEVKDRKTYLKMRLKAYVSDIRDEFKFKSEMTEIVVAKLVEMGILGDE